MQLSMSRLFAATSIVLLLVAIGGAMVVFPVLFWIAVTLAAFILAVMFVYQLLSPDDQSNNDWG